MPCCSGATPTRRTSSATAVPTRTPSCWSRSRPRADDGDLRRLVRGFEGAWPYLELIAGAAGIPDPLDARVVEAYWVGNELLDRVGPTAMGAVAGRPVPDRVGRRAFDRLVGAVPAGALPHHSFHVFGVYPWLGLLRGGRVDEPLRVLDRCRIRWGRVIAITGDGRARVMSRPLAWDGRRLELAAPTGGDGDAAPGRARAQPTAPPGQWCALHWDWVCDRLDRRQLAALRRYTLGQLDVVNAQPFPHPPRSSRSRRGRVPPSSKDHAAAARAGRSQACARAFGATRRMTRRNRDPGSCSMQPPCTDGERPVTVSGSHVSGGASGASPTDKGVHACPSQRRLAADASVVERYRQRWQDYCSRCCCRWPLPRPRLGIPATTGPTTPTPSCSSA